MPAQRILFVKLSSLGDVVHHLPAVTDLARRLPGAHIAWAIEEAYAGLARLHPAVRESIPVGLRGIRSNPRDRERWRRLGEARRRLREGAWDAVVDTQGLLKSAVVARTARGRRYGFDAASAREPLAARFYDVGIPVSRAMHAVERNRHLVAAAFGYAVEGAADYGLAPATEAPSWAPRGRYAVLLHAASRAEKQWPGGKWIELARRLSSQGFDCVFPGGTEAERAAAGQLAASVPRALAAPAMDLTAAAALLARADCVAGVDTGLAHLAVALGRPTVGIYVATDPARTGLHGAAATNVGGRDAEPSVDEVATALARA